MNHLQNNRIVATLPASASTNATTLTVDTQYWDSASFAVLRASNAATTFASVLKVEDSDASGSGYADVTALVGGGTGGFTIPAVSDTSSTSTVKIDVDLKARKRYLRLTVTPSAAIAVAAVCRLGRGDSTPTTASEAGVIGWVRG